MTLTILACGFITVGLLFEHGGKIINIDQIEANLIEQGFNLFGHGQRDQIVNCVANLFINWWAFARIDRKYRSITPPLITCYLAGGHMLFSGQSQSFILPLFRQLATAKTSALLSSLDVCHKSRSLLSRFVSVLSLIWRLNPRKRCPLLPLGREGRGHKNRRTAQPPPQFHSDEGLSSPDESSTLKDVVQALGTLTTTLATTNAKVGT